MSTERTERSSEEKYLDCMSSLENEVKNNKRARVNVNGINVEFSYTSEEQIEYMRRVYYPFVIEDYDRSVMPSSIVDGIADPDLKFRHKNFRDTGIYNNGLTRTSIGNFYNRGDHYSVISDTRFLTKHIYQISDLPVLGLSSLVRRQLMGEFERRFPSVIYYHAGATVSNLSGKATVFSSSGTPEDMGKGKTTSIFANILNKSNLNGFFSNDDVILSSVNDKVKIIQLPSEVKIRDGTLKQIINDGFNITSESQSFNYDNRNGITTTTGSMYECGVSIYEYPNGIEKWVFVDTGVRNSDYNLDELTSEEALPSFISSVRERRMVQTMVDETLGEIGTDEILDQYELIREHVSIEALNQFEILIKSGTKFYNLKAGVDRQKIFELLNNTQG